MSTIERAASGAATARRHAPVSLLLVLDGDERSALRCLTAISELAEGQPEHEIVIVADDAPQLEPVLALLEGDVIVERTAQREGFARAAAIALARCAGDAVVLLHGAPAVAPGFLAPLLDALEDPAVVAAAAALHGEEPDAAAASDADEREIAAATAAASRAATPLAVATAALAVRRADLPPELPDAPPGFELAALALQLARRGEVVVVPGSVAARDSGPQMRRPPGRGEIELSVVIPTLDAAGERTRRCIRAVQATTSVDHEIIVIDNGAPPQGFTAPVNAGLRAARGRYLLVLNDDVEPLPGWWEPLRAELDNGAAVVFPETVGGVMREDFAAWCFALSRATLAEFSVTDADFLDPRLVVWFQDTDLLVRLRAAGRPPRLVRESRIRHRLSQTVRTDEPELRAWIAARIAADKVAFEAKHGSNVAGAAQ